MNITHKLRPHVISIRVTDEAGVQNDTAELELADPQSQLALPATGSKLTVNMGYRETALVFMGEYTINTVTLKSPSSSMHIKAHGADMKPDLQIKRTRSYRNTTVGTVVTDIAGTHGYKAAVSGDVADTPITHLDQTAESDMHLLTRLAKQHGAIAKPAGGHLLFVPAGNGVSALGSKLTAVTLTPADISSYSYTISERDQKQTLNLTLPGNAAIKAETPVRLSDFQAGIPTQWFTHQAQHTLNDSGFSTVIRLTI